MESTVDLTGKNSKQQLPPLPLDVQSFRKIRNENFLYVDKIARDYELPTAKGNHKSKFRFLIENLSKKENKPVVILIDEYDQFIIDYISDDNQREENRKQLKDFFSVLKDSQDFLRFVFITGVSKFTRVSIFSDLNNLIDLTFDPEYSAIAGYTRDELLDYFSDRIRERKTKIHELDNIETNISRVGNMDVGRIRLTPLLFQTGYLTITNKIKKSIDSEEFIIGSPNKDVRISFLTHLLENFSEENSRLINRITKAVEENRIDDVLEAMKGIFAAVPYNNFDPAKEASYHALIHVIFTLILDNIGAEIPTNRGRIDEIIETGKYIYIFEFKMDDAQKALAQIHEKKYYEKYEIKGKEIILVGVSFSKEEKNIKDWIIEPL